MTDATEKCENLAFYDVVDNLVDGITPNFDFSEELSSEMRDVYELRQGLATIIVDIDYDKESITILRRLGGEDEILRLFSDEDFADFNPNFSSNIVAITYDAIRQ